MCIYCAKWSAVENLTPLYEEKQIHVLYYCEKCLPQVKKNIESLPWNHLYSWGQKGEIERHLN